MRDTFLEKLLLHIYNLELLEIEYKMRKKIKKKT